MSLLTFILGLGIGYIAGAGIWRKLLGKLGAFATTASTSTTSPFAKIMGGKAKDDAVPAAPRQPDALDSKT